MKRSQLYAGLLAPLVSFSGIGAAIYVNRSWWRLTNNAISDLGKLGLSHNWLLNVPLVLTAVLALYYYAGLFGKLKNPVGKVGVSVFALGLVFLALIGIFPEGTSPHYYVSWGFFLLASVGYLVAGVGLWFEGRKRIGILTIALFLIELLLTRWAFETFEGVAIPEFIAAFSVMLWHYLVLFSLSRTAQ